MKKQYLSFLIALILVVLSALPSQAASGQVHVLLTTCAGGTIRGTSMTALGKDKSVSLAGLYNVKLSGGKLRIGSQNLTMPVTVTSAQPITWNGASYYGQITFSKAANGFSVGNKLDIEHYLCGVLRAEMSPLWHLEALKAQAVIARTYAIKNQGAHGGFDLCASTHCQDYKGISAEDQTLTAAVTATRGQVLKYNSSVASVYYHSDSGGMITRAGAVWNADFPYLQPRVEPVAYTSPNTTWEATLPMSKIQSNLAAGGINVGSIVSLTPVRRDESGRVDQLRIEGKNKTEIISGHKFRTLMGSTVIKSTLFEFGARSPYNPAAVASAPATVPQASPQQPQKTMSVPSGVNLSDMPSGKDEQIVWMTNKRIFTTQELMEILSMPDQKDKYIELGIARIKGEKPIPLSGSGLGGTPKTSPAAPSTSVGYTKPVLSMTPATGSSVTFYGRGYGHGVGLSQWGAKAMADSGWSYDRILMHYFPGTTLGQ